MLALQAGFTVEFMYATHPLKESDYYILPCISGSNGLPQNTLAKLKEKVRSGARLLISYDGGHIGDFEQLTGLSVSGRRMNDETRTFCLEDTTLSLPIKYSLLVEQKTAFPLAYAKDIPILFANTYGKGKVLFLNAPLERAYTESFMPCEKGYQTVYTTFFKECSRPIVFDSMKCSVTYHKISDSEVGVFITNFSAQTSATFTLNREWNISQTFYCTFEYNKIDLQKKYCYIILKKH